MKTERSSKLSLDVKWHGYSGNDGGTGRVRSEVIGGVQIEFTEEAAIGYKLWSIGYKHVSNAGLGDRNLGRDYIFFNFAIPLTE